MNNRRLSFLKKGGSDQMNIWTDELLKPDVENNTPVLGGYTDEELYIFHLKYVEYMGEN